MIAFLLLGLLACVSAAPHYHHRHLSPFPRHDDFHQRYFQDDIFDTRSFWDELRRELLTIDTVIEDLMKHFPTAESNSAIDGDIYRITIPLPGFEVKDIIVKANKRLVMIQAVHKEGGMAEKSYLDVQSLPVYVNEIGGKWIYEDEILKVEFPLISKPETPVLTTELPHSREDMEPVTDDGTHANADVGVDRGDLGGDKETELLTNEVPSRHNAVEATTYAVDLKDEVEFVPIRSVK